MMADSCVCYELLFCNINQRIYQEKCRSEGQTEDHGAGQVCLVHDAAVCYLHWMEHCEGLLPDVVKIDPQF